MNSCKPHANHAHVHGPSCGHPRVRHDGHDDFLHEGHLHHAHADHVDEHVIAVSSTNPVECTPSHRCGGHDADHEHGPGCGHHAIPHGDHVDYVVSGHLHHAHGSHCDHHGPVSVTG
jgi:hypothetical protein